MGHFCPSRFAGTSAVPPKLTVKADVSVCDKWASRLEEFHPQALPEPCVTLSSHTAHDVRPLP
jgi:hypothetical protein